jgi:hypothetical protein
MPPDNNIFYQKYEYNVFEVKHHLIGQLYLKGHLNLNPVGLLLDITHSNKEKVMGYK